MRALTLVRPMDWAIVHGGKDVENRVWPCPPDAVGKFIAIHSGLKWDKEYEQSVRSHVRASMPVVPQFPTEATWPGGRIVGIVRVVRVVTPEDQAAHSRAHGVLGGMPEGGVDEAWAPPSPWAMDGQHHWYLDWAVPLKVPVEERGAQKLWRVSDAAEAAVRAQIPIGLVFA